MILTIAAVAYGTLAIHYAVVNRSFVRMGIALGAPVWMSILSLSLCAIGWPLCWAYVKFTTKEPADE